MAKKPTTTIRIDLSVKEKANAVFDEIGITLSTAVNSFLKKVVAEGRIPFDINLKNQNLKMPSKNATLNMAFINKKDEFYTLYEDIEKEIEFYKDKLKNKVVLCNCDDPFESSFFKYFVNNFERLQLKTLISTCYKKSSFSGSEYPLEGSKDAYKAIVKRVPSHSLNMPDGSLDLASLFEIKENSLERLDNDGDFRDEECLHLLEQSDVVVTNPPFSLFREYISCLISKKKKFIILGNINAITYKEVFPLFKDNKVWLGETITSGDRKFYVPQDYPLNATNCGIDKNGKRFIRVKGVRWFTNLDIPRRHNQIDLKELFSIEKYPKYDNYDAIEVHKTLDIPKDYDGIMGVPITFIDKYSPEQFEMIMLANGNARTNVPKETLAKVKYKINSEDRGGVPILEGDRTYARIMIKRKNNE